MNKKTKRIVNAIIRKQSKEGWNDSELCRRLGIDNAVWSRIKRGKREPSAQFLNAVAVIFPDLRDLALGYNFNGNSISRE